MAETFIAACVQTTSLPDPAATMAHVAPLVREARAAGADFITTPEVVSMLGPRDSVLANAQTMDAHDGVKAFQALAEETGAWLLAGSMVVKLGKDRLANRSMLFAPDGRLAATYDKIHMFDVDLEGGESYRESNTYQPGDTAVAVDLPWARLGMTVCYDMRFPYLYRDLAHAGAQVLTVPSAFTVPTGRAHWHVLLRSRAIETGCFVLAAAQVGQHFPKRKTYGHSIIISPWGEVLAEREDDTPGVITAEIAVAKVKEARQMVPSLHNDRPYAAPAAAPDAAAE
ncbi:MAG: carbon-nitrogen hydrolase family protein [Alphaproteobacteria bacterium]|nr:carbon-nitrogen hydrolase family protein [Alphaproteobacteria bacterium]MCB9928445.1 carbon-nitrogen hydrolase family protein [Alphaproteobacteria bacterium]